MIKLRDPATFFQWKSPQIRIEKEDGWAPEHVLRKFRSVWDGKADEF